MPRRPTPPAQRARVVKAVLVGGLTLRAAAAQFKLSAPTVKRWVDEAKKRPPDEPEPAPAPTPDPDPTPGPPAGANTLEMTRWMRDDLLRLAREARTAGNYTAAQGFASQAVKLSHVIPRLEKSEAVDGDSVRYSRAEIDDAMRTVRERWAALLARPLLCHDCGRKLSASFAGYDIDAIEKDRVNREAAANAKNLHGKKPTTATDRS